MGNQKDQFVLSHIIREFLHPDLEANFVKRCRRRLIKSIQPVDAIVDALREVGVLNTANLEAISIHADQREKQRILVDQVLWKGNKAQDAFFLALARSNPFVLQELDQVETAQWRHR
uniref:CARD domain-containing protein n=1 Tax=Takifugu rubripes TaxID=31033 RepID=A0A674MG62_TAKRU